MKTFLISVRVSDSNRIAGLFKLRASSDWEANIVAVQSGKQPAAWPLEIGRSWYRELTNVPELNQKGASK